MLSDCFGSLMNAHTHQKGALRADSQATHCLVITSLGSRPFIKRVVTVVQTTRFTDLFYFYPVEWEG